jgi:pimeloyl-ACP methyl ester carboxylesterase
LRIGLGCMRRALLLAVTFTALGFAPAWAELTTSRHALDLALANVSTRSRQRVDEVFRTTDPVFIFIPGILGSRLTTPTGTVLWGELDPRHPVVSRQLAYQVGQEVKTELLMHFQTFGYDLDVYDKFFEDVRLLKISDIEHLLVFPYDWRQDLRDSALQFDRALRSPGWTSVVGARDVILVAHSMGGLVATYWFNKYYIGHEREYPFRLARVVYLGTPHRGAASTLLSLTDGYTCDNCGAFEQRVFGFFFKNLGDVAFTFPALFQLLPLDVFVYEEDASKRLQPRDHFSVQAWTNYQWGDSARKHAGLSWPQFIDRIKPLLVSARSFQTEMADFKSMPDAVYFYGSTFPTPNTIVYAADGKTRQVVTRIGDGRVPEDIAKDQPRTRNAIQFRGVTSEHGALPHDPTFLAFVRDLCDEYDVKPSGRLADLIRDDDELLPAMADAGVLLPMATRNGDAAGQIVVENLRIVERYMRSHHIRAALGDELRTVAASTEKAGHVTDAIALWLLYGTQPATDARYESSLHVGTLLGHSNPTEAIAVLRKAESATSAEPHTLRWNREMADTQNAIADVFSASGDIANADAHRKTAATLSIAAGQIPPVTDKSANGKAWRSWSSTEKLFWAIGYAQGYLCAVERVDVAGGPNSECASLAARVERQTFSERLNGFDIASGLEKFYDDPANEYILLGTAFRIYLLQAQGKDTSTVQELIETARRLGREAAEPPNAPP